MEAQGDSACLGHLGGVTYEPEASDVGGSVKSKINRQLGGVAIEAFHPGNRIGEFIGGSEATFKRGGDDASAKGFGEEEAVARTQAGFGQELVVLNNAEGNETKFGFFILDGMPAGDHDASFEGFFSRTAHDSLGYFKGQCGRQGGNIEREEGLTAHRIDVREGIGSRYRAEVVGIVHDGGEKVDGGYERMLLVEAPNSSIVGGFKPDEKIRVGRTLKCFFDWQQNLRQRFRVDFGRSARASGERSQADGRGVSHESNHT